MSCPIGKENLAQLKAFIELCDAKPEILSLPELEFFKGYIESLGGKIPSAEMEGTEEPDEMAEEVPEEPESTPDKEEAEPESDSDLEFDTKDCLEPDEINEELQVMGDPSKQVSEEDTEQADEKRREAISQLGEGNSEKAVELFGEAININPQSALLFAKRGQAYLKLSKPNACIRDCTRALELNCDSAAAYKFRGRAYRLLGEWEKAAQDLRQAVKIDYDEQSDEWLREVQPNAHKIEQHRLKQERKRLEKEELDRIRRVKLAREAYKAASTAKTHPDRPGLSDVYKLLEDPEILSAFQDPEVTAAFQDITTNPANLSKYQSNPKIKTVLEKLASKVKTEGMSFPNFPGFSTGTSEKPPSTGTSEAPPSTGTSEVPPSTGTSEAPPSTGTTETPPSTGTTEAPPSTGTTEAPPSTGTNEESPSKGSSEKPPKPTTDDDSLD